jgi:hypothetical protein
MRREKTSLVSEGEAGVERGAVQRLRPGDAMRVAVKRWMDCDFLPVCGVSWYWPCVL